MHPIYLIQILCAVLAVGVTGIALSKWRQPRLMYFTCLTILISLITVGYLFEITAPSLDAAVLAAKLQQLGTPFIGALYFLFSLDCCGTTPPRRQLPILFLLPVATMLAAFTWPLQTWYYLDVSFVQTGSLHHLALVPGVFYYLSFAYNLLLSAMGAGFILHNFRAAGPEERRHAVVMLVAMLLPLSGQVLHLLGVLASGWNLIPLFLTASAAGLAWYIAHFRHRDWQNLGRELAVENMKDAFVLLDTRGRFMDANLTAYRYFPGLLQMRAGMPATADNGFPRQLLTRDDASFTITLEGETLYLRSSRTPLQEGGKPLGTGIMIYDDTENQHLMDELQQMATHDALTGLYNRGTFFTYSTRDFALNVRKREPGSVLMMDLDNFKLVNDQYGHAVGDKVLIGVTQVLLARLRHTDICGRYGGEELAVWLPGAALEGAAIIADVIRRAVEHTTFEANGKQFHVTISVGVSAIDYKHLPSFEELVNLADNALYQAKNGGRNRVCVYQSPATEPEKED